MNIMNILEQSRQRQQREHQEWQAWRHTPEGMLEIIRNPVAGIPPQSRGKYIMDLIKRK